MPRRRQYDHEAMRALAAEGLGWNAIAGRLGCDRSTVRSALGRVSRPRAGYTRADPTEVRRMADQGFKRAYIAYRLNVSPSVVTRILGPMTRKPVPTPTLRWRCPDCGIPQDVHVGAPLVCEARCRRAA